MRQHSLTHGFDYLIVQEINTGGGGGWGETEVALLVHLVKLSLEDVVKHSPMGGELKLTTRTGLFFLVVSSINYLNLFALEKEDKKWHPVKTNI